MPTMRPAGISVRFWGVRGSVPCPGPRTIRYGGNTSCVELRCGEHLIILDGGTGLVPLGESLLEAGKAVTADILYTHTHIDHVMGLPFFAPARQAETMLTLWAERRDGLSLEQVLRQIFSPPLLPLSPSEFGARFEYRDFRAGDVIELRPGVSVQTAPLNHPDGAAGYRVEHDGKAVAYVTDTEHMGDGPDQNVLRLVNRADLMIYDSTYDDREFEARVGCGHSTWQEALRLAAAAGAKRVALFHHDPAKGDDALDDIARRAEAIFPASFVASEGMALKP